MLLSIRLSVSEMVLEMTVCTYTPCLPQVEVTVNDSILIVSAWTFQDEHVCLSSLYLHTKEELYGLIYVDV